MAFYCAGVEFYVDKYLTTDGRFRYGKLLFTEILLKTLHRVNKIKWHRYL